MTAPSPHDYGNTTWQIIVLCFIIAGLQELRQLNQSIDVLTCVTDGRSAKACKAVDE